MKTEPYILVNILQHNSNLYKEQPGEIKQKTVRSCRECVTCDNLDIICFSVFFFVFIVFILFLFAANTW